MDKPKIGEFFRVRFAPSRLVVFGILLAAFAFMAVLIPAALPRVALLLPDNYKQIARKAVQDGDFESAIRRVQLRIGQHNYDFEAHYLLAEIMAKRGDFHGAADVIKEAVAKAPAARASTGTVIGYDEASVLRLMAEYLWRAEEYAEAGEMARAAFDAGAKDVLANFKNERNQFASREAALAWAGVALKQKNRTEFSNAIPAAQNASEADNPRVIQLQARWMEEVDGDRRAAQNLLEAAISDSPREPALRLMLENIVVRSPEARDFTNSIARVAETRELPPEIFKLPVGASATRNAIAMGRNGAASAEIQTGAYKYTKLLFSADGSSALGVFPIVVIRQGERELMRIYADSVDPRVYELELWPEGAPKQLELQLAFINDEYEPYTKADRNVTISDMMLF